LGLLLFHITQQRGQDHENRGEHGENIELGTA